MSSPVEVSPRVAEAVAANEPVVALETTLVTHGFPTPEGLEMAVRMEEAVRKEGALPATVGILNGNLIVGLTPTELQRLAESKAAAKVNLSNLAAQLASGRPGSTTVAATMFAAAVTGIRFFATGGIGGVHRGAAETGDISADLPALARFKVAVVCAGAKAILDLPRTVEYLETAGVPIFGFGTDELPAFYRRSSGLAVDRGFKNVQDLARAVDIHLQLGLGGGLVVGNPIPPEFEMEADLYDRSLAQALEDLARQGIRGRGVTPFLLGRLRDLTEGSSSFSNRGLLLDNARLAARLAYASKSGSP